ncbi:CRISPR-associated CARF protein Csx1 [Sulfuracidifex metallicus]|uniref:TIGR01897 family CRISPR-associated protein n=1 Tax=Sulfuracidifex metallicus DSM 6482 = JCM 9184 TaxID=523847 RepID=A0A6A9QR76_SULME|nr:CRISPR-associated CARF protein Csx1 [Sulfuracidifex metallicus]MUN29805.1 TIGR01897 family CRISPR-associated protein [Sulfuracidifex metallicus DSM 6482 = JCM 9184]WOE51810.1 CRISPR-associated CARF protein Csx1 [Sulfuracidifex metallicus DSM 6482 = JCM 9184]
MKFLISIVGKPSGYKNVKYVYKGAEKKSNFSSSLVKELEKPDVSVLIGQFTLAHEKRTLSKDVSMKDLQDLSLETMKESLQLDDYQIIVSPGVVSEYDKKGSPNAFYKGDIYNFYGYTLHSLANIFLDHVKGMDNDDIEIVLDLTHGINYMGYLTFDAVSLVADVMSTKFSVRMRVVNSDPFPLWFMETPILNINEVMNLDVKPSFSYPVGEGCVKSLRPSSVIPDMEKKGVYDQVRGEQVNDGLPKVESKHFVNSLNRGSLLSAFYFNDDFELCVKKAVDLFESNIVVNSVNPLTVIQRLSFTETFQSYVVANMLKKLHGFPNQQNLDDGVSIDEIQKLSEIYCKSQPLLFTIINNELHSLQKVDRENWTPLSKILNTKDNPDERTFYAHAGLPGGFTEVRRDRAVRVRYSRDMLGKVKSFLG